MASYAHEHMHSHTQTHTHRKKWKTTCTCMYSKHKEAKSAQALKSLEASNNDSTVYRHMADFPMSYEGQSSLPHVNPCWYNTHNYYGLWNYMHVHVHVGMHALYRKVHVQCIP